MKKVFIAGAAVVALAGIIFSQSLTNGVANTFDKILAGTNTNTLTIGTGGSIVTSGTGSISASSVNGTTVAASSAADQVLTTTASGVAVFGSVPGCLDSAGNHVNYSTTTHLFSCGTSAPSPAFSQVTAATNAVALVMGTGGSLTTSGTGTINANQLAGTSITGITGPVYFTAGVPTAETNAQAVTSLGTNPALGLGTTTFNGAMRWNQTTVSDTAYTALTSDNVIIYSTLTAARIVTLPSASGSCTSTSCLILIIKDGAGTANANNLTITPASGTIDGAANLKISANYGSMKITSNGTNWLTLP